MSIKLSLHKVYIASIFYVCVFFYALLVGTNSLADADNQLLADVDKQWLCDNQELIFARVDEGDPQSYYHAGMLFFQGFCVIRDLPFAFSLFVDAAKSGHVDAYHSVALMSQIGLGTRRDVESADKIFSELLARNYAPTVRYACAIQKGEDERIKLFPKLESLENYTGCKN